MINSISSGMSMPPARTEQSLTSDQQSLISETLEQFDPENLSDSDAASIIEAFSQAGIQPGQALETAMAEFGFDAKSIGEQGNVQQGGQRPPPPPSQSTEEISSMVEYLTELMEEKYAENNNSTLSDDDKQSIMTELFEKLGIPKQDSIINTTA